MPIKLGENSILDKFDYAKLQSDLLLKVIEID